MTFDLPFPHADLSPNSRKHWAVKSKRVKAARAYAFMMVRDCSDWASTVFFVRAEKPAKIGISMTFHPPSKRKRDLDNLISSMKSALDGIADALQVNDHRFYFARVEIGDVSKPGHVHITVEPQ
jgi:crossover junction endodeoxyribonuclease RusA